MCVKARTVFELPAWMPALATSTASIFLCFRYNCLNWSGTWACLPAILTGFGLLEKPKSDSKLSSNPATTLSFCCWSLPVRSLIEARCCRGWAPTSSVAVAAVSTSLSSSDMRIVATKRASLSLRPLLKNDGNKIAVRDILNIKFIRLNLIELIKLLFLPY